MLTWVEHRAVLIVTAFVLAALAALPASAPAQALQPRAVVEAYLAAVNASQLEPAMAFYADDVPQKAAIRRSLQTHFEQGSFRMDAVAYRVDGNEVTWDWTVTYAPYDQPPIPPLTGTTTARVAEGRFHTIQGGVDPASEQRRQAAIQTLSAKPVVGTVRAVAPPNTQDRDQPSLAVWAAAAACSAAGGIGIAAVNRLRLPVRA